MPPTVYKLFFSVFEKLLRCALAAAEASDSSHRNRVRTREGLSSRVPWGKVKRTEEFRAAGFSSGKIRIKARAQSCRRRRRSLLIRRRKSSRCRPKVFLPFSQILSMHKQTGLIIQKFRQSFRCPKQFLPSSRTKVLASNLAKGFFCRQLTRCVLRRLPAKLCYRSR